MPRLNFRSQEYLSNDLADGGLLPFRTHLMVVIVDVGTRSTIVITPFLVENSLRISEYKR